MIKDNIIYFGYGTVAVYSGVSGFKFTEIKPPHKKQEKTYSIQMALSFQKKLSLSLILMNLVSY